MKFRMLVKDINIRALVSGDKQMRITLETLYPGDITSLKDLSEKMEIDVDFLDISNYDKQ